MRASPVLTYGQNLHENLFQNILSELFAPQLPQVDAVILCGHDDFTEQGSCGTAQPKQYRDALDRFNKTGRV